MHIKIAERLKPYSHIPGTICVLPNSNYLVQVFPTLVKVLYPNRTLFKTFPLDVQGPLEDFTLQCDLEKGLIQVWGDSPKGFIRYYIYYSGTEIKLTFDKPKYLSDMFLERLSLGNSKAQDWDMVQRRCDLTEIFPVWHRLGQLLPSQIAAHSHPGALTLLQECAEAIHEGHPEFLAALWKSLFQVGFNGILSPRIWDDQYQGIIPAEGIDSCVSPLHLLTEGARLIRELFIHYHHSIIEILPSLPPEFHCGRLINVNIPGGKIALEWTKKVIRRIELTLSETQEIHFKFRSNVREFRLKMSKADPGKKVSCGCALLLEKNTYYLFDNFK